MWHITALSHKKFTLAHDASHGCIRAPENNPITKTNTTLEQDGSL